MTIHRLLLFVIVCNAVFSRSNADQTGSNESGAIDEQSEYNPKCRPLEDFEQEQSRDLRVKREEASTLLETQPDQANEEVVAQPGYFVPAVRRRPCFGRRRAFTAGCGPPAKAYQVKNFVMAKNPAMRRRPFARRNRLNN